MATKLGSDVTGVVPDVSCLEDIGDDDDVVVVVVVRVGMFRVTSPA